ncbi:MAG TPA: cytochrome c [Longimicrobiales bacterium]|nr:cytochrome c [Longimicrobiales bacterium]
MTLACALAAGCAEHHFEPPDREEQVAEAETGFSMAAFDSVSWESDDQRALDGNVVYSTYCRNCHGPLGMGGTEYARVRDLDVPSLVEPDWQFAESRDSVLHRIFVGHSTGMPTWGVAGISPRAMDAVTHYLLNVLRPEVLGG